MRFSVEYCGAKSRVVTISLSPQGGAYTRALKSEGSLSYTSSYVGEQWIQMTGALWFTANISYHNT